MPFKGPIAAARVGYKDGQYLLNPTTTEIKTESKLDLVVAGTREGVLMVESEAKILPEDVMLGAVLFGHQQMQVAIEARSRSWLPRPASRSGTGRRRRRTRS